MTIEKSDHNEIPTAERTRELAEFCVKCIEDKQGENILMLPLAGRPTVADYFVIATVNSDPQLQAMVSHIERQVREKFQLRPLSRPGGGSGGWELIDFSDVVVHLMTAEVRERYNLEAIWSDVAAGRRRQNHGENN